MAQAFEESVKNAHEAQLEWIEIKPTPPIFRYSPVAMRTIGHLIDAPNYARLTWRGLDQLGYETQRARRLLSTTTEFNDQAEVKEGLEEALDAVEGPFPSASSAEANFIREWVDLLEVGIEEVSYGEEVFAYLDAQQDLVEAARHGLRTGRFAEVDALLEEVYKARQTTDAIGAMEGEFFDRRDELCDELVDNPDLQQLRAAGHDFCAETRKPDLGPPVRDQRQASPQAKPASSKPKPAAPKPKLNTGSKLSTEGIGPVLVGMTVPEASKAAGAQLEPIRQSGSSPGCQYFRIPSLKGVDIMVSSGTVARVDVTTPAVSTLSGIRVGDPEDAVAAAYGDHLVAEPLYDHDGAIYTYIPDDPSDNTRLVITVLEGSVFSIRAGRLPEVEYVEGCV